MIRIDKYLCDFGNLTRSEAKKAIASGRVMCNGSPLKDAAFKVDENTSVISLDGKELRFQKEIYLVMNKPAGYVTSRSEKEGKTVFELLNDFPQKNLEPIGRLDKDTEGILLFTTDGKMNHFLLSPKRHVPKTYFVETKYTISQEDIDLLKEGVFLDGDEKKTLPCKAEKIDDTHLYLTLTEGRFHQVKRMLQAVSNEVVYLRRDSFGEIRLSENFLLGTVRELKENEIDELKKTYEE